MKTLIIAAFALISVSVHASGTKEKSVASFRCIQNFEKEFGYIEDVKWSNAMNHMTRADFTSDDEQLTAYFDQNGEFVASTCNIGFDDLPKALRLSIKEKLPDVNITTSFKVMSKNELSYFFETEKDGVKQLYKGQAFGNFTKYYVNN